MYTNYKKSLLVNEKSMDMIEVFACNEDEILPGEKREVVLINDVKALLIRSKEGELFAVANKCPHYGAPLAMSALGTDNRIRCPYHGACFNLKTGDIEDYPGLDCLPVYQVLIQDDKKIIIKAPKSSIVNQNGVGIFRHRKSMNMPIKDAMSYVIIGGGPAGLTAAETLRKNGYDGELKMLAKENYLPYDRTKISKMMNASIENVQLRDAEFYAEYKIDIELNCEVKSIDLTNQTIHLKDARKFPYNKLLLATGAKPRSLSVPGAELKNVFYMRSLNDAHSIIQSAKDSDVLVIGTSFIGLEVAACLSAAGMAKSVTVLGQGSGSEPLASILGSEVGASIRELHEGKGVRVLLNEALLELVPSDNGSQVVAAKLKSGVTLSVQLVVVGIGVIPEIDYLPCDIKRDTRGYIEVNESMETSVKNVFAAGDVCSFPFEGSRSSIGHWGIAQQLGQAAAIAMLGRSNPIRDLHIIPFFWSMQFGKGLRFAGFNDHYQQLVSHGDFGQQKFVVFYLSDNKVTGVCTMNYDPVCSVFAERLNSSGPILLPQDLQPETRAKFVLNMLGIST